MRICNRCNKNFAVEDKTKFRRGYCNNCYEFLRKNKLIKISRPPTATALTFEQEQHLIGSLLGDGCLMLEKEAINSRLAIARIATDCDYLKWQINIFQNLCKEDPFKLKNIIDKRHDKISYQCYFRTRNCKVLNSYYNEWYGSGIKKLPPNLKLTPLILLIWFLDDGSMHLSKKGRLTMSLATNCFTKIESQYLANQLTEMTGYYFGVHKSHNSFLIQGTDGACRAFANLIDNIFPSCMLRKAKWRLPEAKFNDPNLKIFKSRK